MRENRFYTFAVGAVLMIILVLSTLQLLSVREQPAAAVSVILRDSRNSRWIPFREGAKQAAREENIELNMVATDPGINPQEEISLLRRELDSGTKGVILEPVSTDGFSEVIEELLPTLPLVLVESETEFPVELNPALRVLHYDDEAMGRAIAAELRIQADQLKTSGQSGRIQVGIFTGDLRETSQQKRLDGLLAGLPAEQYEIIFQRELRGDSEAEKQSQLLTEIHKSRMDMLCALEDDALVSCADFLDRTGRRYLRLVGLGISNQAVYALDAGCAQSLIVPEEFDMGYQAVKMMSEKLKHSASSETEKTVHYRIIHRDNMYSEENQRILFPLVE